MKQFFKFFFASVLGTIFAFFLFFAILFGIIGIIAASAGDDEAETSAENSILYFDFQEEMADRTSNDPFANFDFSTFSSAPKIGLNDVLKNLEKAAKDEQVKGIFLDLTIVEVGFASINEIRNAMLEFKKSGKFIYVFGEILDQNAYYLATAGDKIYLHPGGLMQLTGLSSQRMFFKGSLEKLGVDMQVIRHGKFKSAVEPFTREDMSEENRIQTEAFLNSMWSNMVAGIATARNIETTEIQSMANTLAVTSPASAVELKLVDGVKFRDEVIAEMKEKISVEEKEDLNFVEISKYTNVNVKSEDEKSLEDYKNKVAVIYASGEINTGESEDDVMGSKTISEALEEARKNENVKAVVLRVNSPGGSSLASDIIWREVELLKAVKPVVVSMGNLAASGGYYIACGANKILADENTITGSIGVFGLIPNFKGMLNDKLGITIDTVNTNTYADLASPFRPLKPVEVLYITDLIERIYSDFVNKVSAGRGMTFEQVDSIGQGRVWSGSDALKLGLVDEIGGLSRAIELAAELGEVESYNVLELPEEKDPFETMITDLTENMEAKMAEKYFGNQFERLNAVYQSVTKGGIFMRLPYDLTVQ